MDMRRLAGSARHVRGAIFLFLGACASVNVSDAAAEERIMECARDCPRCVGGVSRHIWKYEKSPSGDDNVYIRIKRRWQAHCAATIEGPATTRSNVIVKRNIANWRYECEMSSVLIVWNDGSRKPYKSTDLGYEIDFVTLTERSWYSVNGKAASDTRSCTPVTEQEADVREPGVKR